VVGCDGSPAIFTATRRPFSSRTVTSMAQVSGQSCGQAARTTRSVAAVVLISPQAAGGAASARRAKNCSQAATCS